MPILNEALPQTYLQLLKKSMLLYRRSFIAVYPLALLSAIIYFVPRFYTLFLEQDIIYDIAYLSPLRTWLVLVDIIGFVFFMALLFRIYCINQNKHENFLDDLAMAIKKIPIVMVSAVVQMILLLFIIITISLFYQFFIKNNVAHFSLELTSSFWLASILVMNVGIGFFLLILFIFYMPLIVIENKGIFSSLKKSAHLVWGNWWRTFWLQITPFLIYTLFLVLIKYLFHLEIHFYFGKPLQQFSWFAIALQMLAFSIILPWIASLLLVQLQDLESLLPKLINQSYTKGFNSTD